MGAPEADRRPDPHLSPVHLGSLPPLRNPPPPISVAQTLPRAFPVTSVSRTLEDLRATSLLPPRPLRRATRQAELKGYRLDQVIKTDRTRSDLESLFLAIVRSHNIPLPEVNVKLGRWTVDFLWRSQRVVVETDFWSYHRGSVAFEDDHARDLDLRAAGYAVLRFTDRQIEGAPGRVVADVARALSQEVAHSQR